MSETESLAFFIERLFQKGVSKNRYPRAGDSEFKILASNPEITQNVVMKVFPKSPWEGLNLVERLQDDFGIEFCGEGISSVYDSLISNNQFYHTKRLAEATGIYLSESQKETFWNNFFHSPWKKTELEMVYPSKYIGKPKLSSDEFNSVINDALRMWAGEETERNNKSSRKTMIQPEDLMELLDIMGSNPDVDKDVALRAYVHQIPLLSNPYCESRFKFLNENAGISPQNEPILEEKIREFYRQSFSPGDLNHPSSRTPIGDLEKILSISGLSIIEEDRQYVEDFYRNHLSPTTVDLIRDVERITRINVSEEVINSVFERYLLEGDVESINSLSDALKRNPVFNSESVHEAYNLLISEGKLDRALKVYLLTEIEPSIDTETISRSYEFIERNLLSVDQENIRFPVNYNALKWMKKRFPEETSGFLRKQVKKFIENSSFQKAMNLKTELDIEPNPEDGYVLACEFGNWRMAKEIYEKDPEIIDRSYPLYAGLSPLFGFVDN